MSSVVWGSLKLKPCLWDIRGGVQMRATHVDLELVGSPRGGAALEVPKHKRASRSGSEIRCLHNGEQREQGPRREPFHTACNR